MYYFLNIVKNSVAKRGFVHYKQLLLLTQCFHKSYSSDVSVCEKGINDQLGQVRCNACLRDIENSEDPGSPLSDRGLLLSLYNLASILDTSQVYF